MSYRPSGITTPVTLDSATGEVAVQKGSGKTRVRSGQTVEEYEQQKTQWFEEDSAKIRTESRGLQEHIATLRDKSTDLTIKRERQFLMDELTWLYYHGYTAECRKEIETNILPRLEALEDAKLKKKISKELASLHALSQRCLQ